MRKSLTQFGIEVRKARIDVDKSSREIAEFLGISASYLSQMENGRKPIPIGMVAKMEEFFLQHGKVLELKELALMSNGWVPLDAEMTLQQKQLLCRLATQPFPPWTLNHLESIMKGHQHG